MASQRWRGREPGAFVGKSIRERQERELELALLGLWRRELDRLLELLREEQSTLPNAYWQGLEERQREVLEPWLLRVILLGVANGAEMIGLRSGKQIEISWELVNLDAAAWARDYSYELVGGITETTRDRLQSAIGEWIEAGEAFPDLVERVSAIYDDPARARMIAATEATRAFVEGNVQVWQADGIPPAGVQPPAHPNCRCNVRPKRLRDGTWLLIWYTARDELTRRCDAEIMTPWGMFIGCAAMHKRVVSEGLYGGMVLDDVSEAE